MIGHLGARVSALLDGQLSARETEEAWAHVYTCHACRDLVEREGWVKTRLAGLSAGERSAPSDLKGSLLRMPPGDAILARADVRAASRRPLGVAVLGGGAVGAAVVGVIALGLTSGTSPAERQPPVTQINTSVPASPGPSTAVPGPATGGPAAPSGATGVVLAPLRRMLP